MTGRPTEFELAEAGAGDLEGCQALWRRCGLPDALPASDSEKGCLLVALRRLGEATDVAGCVAVRIEGDNGWLIKLAVEPELRGSGLARRLMRMGETWLRERGATEAQVLLGPADVDARRVSEAFGYATASATLLSRHLEGGRSRPLPPSATPAPQAVEPGKLVNTVTFLEMRKRPPLQTLQAPSGRATALLRCLRPTVAFYRFLYNTVGAPWLWWERRALDDATLAEIVQDDKVEIYVLYVDGQPVGYAELDRRKKNEIELAYFGLMPEFVGQRLGPYLLSSAIDIAWSYEPLRLWVNTNTLDHPKALPLYQRMGFVPYAQERKVIDDPRLSGLMPE
ncbi:GNAT family N-acetyltransferase [Algihabitans albus]|uniref:GNAT family N-acetyltransferase n=1 Tax=Algihabitans albus TaxID=2164067 RepID=UPI0013C30947|nr:GNAT family N-acetyltransferase [Algihabitans albus]